MGVTCDAQRQRREAATERGICTAILFDASWVIWETVFLGIDRSDMDPVCVCVCVDRNIKMPKERDRERQRERVCAYFIYSVDSYVGQLHICQFFLNRQQRRLNSRGLYAHLEKDSFQSAHCYPKQAVCLFWSRNSSPLSASLLNDICFAQYALSTPSQLVHFKI